MMIIVAISRRTGMFEYLAIRSAKMVKANPAAIMLVLQIVTAVVSAFLDNVTTVLLVVPVTLIICDHLGVKPYPFLVAQVFASNIGGTATLIGDPPNILIGSRVGLSFNDFVINLTPAIIVIQLVACGLFHVIWGRNFEATMRARAKVMAFDERSAIVDRRRSGHSDAQMSQNQQRSRPTGANNRCLSRIPQSRSHLMVDPEGPTSHRDYAS